jgi:hypothetical protein
MSKGESPSAVADAVVGSNCLKRASGFLKMSAGPMNPAIARFVHTIAASAENAALAPLESLERGSPAEYS